MEHERVSDMPAPLRWTMVFIKQLGFPVVVSIGLWYLCNVTIKENTKATADIMTTIQVGFADVKASLDTQNRILRRRDQNEAFVGPVKVHG